MRLRKKPGFGNFQIRAYYYLLYFNSNGYGFGFSFIFGIAGRLNLNLNLVSAFFKPFLTVILPVLDTVIFLLPFGFLSRLSHRYGSSTLYRLSCGPHSGFSRPARASRLRCSLFLFPNTPFQRTEQSAYQKENRNRNYLSSENRGQ